MTQVSNRSLVLPYVAPLLAYVFIASTLKEYIPIEVNYLLRMIVVAGLLLWAWKWYIPIRGPKSPSMSIVIGVIAGLIGLFLWISLLTPFLNYDTNEPWSGTAFTLRLLSAGLFVPIFEELVMRGFVFRLAYQWGEARRNKESEPLQATLDDKCIDDVSPGSWSWIAIVCSTLVFASGHHVYEWLAAIAFGLLMSALWIIRKDLLSCIVAHGVTNVLLAIYVFQTDSWYLW